jgi:hypothetical protein
MIRYVFTIFFIFILSISLYSQTKQSITLSKPQENIDGTSSIIELNKHIIPVLLPESGVKAKIIKPLIVGQDNKSIYPGLLEQSIISTDTALWIMPNSEKTYFEIDTRTGQILSYNYANAPILSAICLEAISQAPVWLRDQLTLKLGILTKRNVADVYAQLILDSEIKYKDEVAFCIANLSEQTLTDTRFTSDRQMLIRNAQMIYKYADSLQYVRIIEQGDYASGNYGTTTEYRVLDSITGDTIWSKIPMDVYYWYLVLPKLDQEGVYVTDNNNDNSGQRTYGYAWRDFIWNNPDPSHDYRNVNITTTKGSITTIPRFSDLIKQPRILWDRNKTYYNFGRPYDSKNSALDLIGNWCSQAVPVDVVLPRAFQPNQVLIKHNGMCNEDAFLVAAACRTALIPIIYLNTSCEDHDFGAIYDKDWNHFEFFRGGLQVPGNQFYGITSMLDRGSYGWVTSIVEGFRGDGYPKNHTSYYADTCTFNVTVTDTLGNPVDGALLTIYASPNAYNNNYTIAGYFWTDKYGKAVFGAGEKKSYLIQVYHPKYGWNPTDSTQAFFLSNGQTVKLNSYDKSIPYTNLKINELQPVNINPPTSGNYGVRVQWTTQDIMTGTNPRESLHSRFYLWNPDNKGSITYFICDSINFSKYTNNLDFECYSFNNYTESGVNQIAFPTEGKWYVVFSNYTSTINYQKVSAVCQLLKDVSPVEEPIEVKNDITITPNPFSDYCSIQIPGNASSVEIFDIFGRQVSKLSSPYVWQPDGSIYPGMYYIVINRNNEKIYKKVMLTK